MKSCRGPRLLPSPRSSSSRRGTRPRLPSPKAAPGMPSTGTGCPGQSGAPWLLPWSKNRCLPQPGLIAAGDPLLPEWFVSLATKGLSCGLDSAQPCPVPAASPHGLCSQACYLTTGAVSCASPREGPAHTAYLLEVGLRVQPAASHWGPKPGRKVLCETLADQKAAVSPGGRDLSSRTGGRVSRWGQGFWEHRAGTNFMGKAWGGQEDSRACCG